ncbi:MAG TPA: Na+:solute symporter, partial [bacterium]|nr:Na+:solute symporter [bacterium]
PNGLLGLVIASLAAAYMSTISTHLNWGASYVVDDFYKRFINPSAGSRHYVTVARSVTVVLMILACLLSFYLENALQAFQILLQIGAGTGLIFLLRWFWWRINAWTEIAAMIVSFGVAVYFEFFHARVLGFTPLEDWQRLVAGVLITTPAWLIVTFLTPPTEKGVLQRFYDKIQPLGPGWAGAVETSAEARPDSITAGLMAVFLGIVAVYAALFATGYCIYGNWPLGLGLAVVCLAAAAGLIKILPQINWRG